MSPWLVFTVLAHVVPFAGALGALIAAGQGLINWRLCRTLLIAFAVGYVINLGILWVHNKDSQIHHAQTQRNAAVHTLVLSELDLIAARVNEVTLSDAIGRQNAAVAALGAERDRTVAALAEAAQRARVATAAANRSAAALLAGHAGRDPCVSALGVARSLP